MGTHDAPCSYCPVVNKLHFWGPQQPANWKRPTVLVISLIFALGIPILIVSTWMHPNVSALALVSAPIFAIAVFGLAVAVSGCNACVARIAGDF